MNVSRNKKVDFIERSILPSEGKHTALYKYSSKFTDANHTKYTFTQMLYKYSYKFIDADHTKYIFTQTQARPLGSRIPT